MASVSFSLTRTQVGVLGGPGGFTKSTQAPSAGAIELRIDNAVALRKVDVLNALVQLENIVLADTTLVS